MASSKVSKKEKKVPIWGSSVSDFRKLKSEEKKTLSKDELKQYKRLKHKVKKLKVKKKLEDNASKKTEQKSTESAETERNSKNVAAADGRKEKPDDGNRDYWLGSQLSGGNQRKSKFLKMLGINGGGEDPASKDKKGGFEHERERQLEQQYMSGIHQKGNRKGLGM
ncbi:nucleolar RNA binding protein, KNOP1-like protein, implicated in mRNA processing [Schizosaccharomyces osmophilus]|uniref:Nucleolar RNA binding protein, KNOP1-like protein, implicated in mRNA processing n=1 Tax=Schizosaccharomyces osmophilus TaxID=2545709 RepID=A0AAE9W7H7_9SCHI|nr:nucleolar RNA binding protein, KNOP1-like protein, implicated in mRNA processing [Schizosaccharomyces osmophilus]WBW71321.1 nucleolar RNA binding protein, KNOP1-like protein, implicated in mRNA processing [Schizosaccharomyces osmophilus]